MAAMSAPEEQQREELNAFLGPSKYRDELQQTVWRGVLVSFFL